MDLQLLALIVLVILFVLQWRHSAGRFEEMERKIAELTEVKEDLQRMMAKQRMGVSDPAVPPSDHSSDVSENQAATEKTAPAAEAVQNPIVPVGRRHLAVVTPKPMVAVQPPQVPAAVPDDIPPEVVAVIMAAVAAYGCSPAGIRSIRKKPARSYRWVLAGRLAGMR